MRGPHDVGGGDGGPIDRTAHDHEPWEKRVDALLNVLAKQGIIRVDELRRGIEALGADAYDRLSYYERWIASIADNLVRKGVLTVDELGRKLAEVEERARRQT